MKRGYLYIASIEQFIEEAVISAHSLKTVEPSAHITLITSQSVKPSVFNQILVRPLEMTNKEEWGFFYKVKNIYFESPYDETFFLDSDTYFYESGAPLFDLLEYFDICMAQAPAEEFVGDKERKQTEGYPVYNTGVMVFKKNQSNQFLFEEWISLYKKHVEEPVLKRMGDQGFFTDALFRAHSRICILPNVWNVRIPYYVNLAGSAKIIHGRHRDYAELKRRLNETTSNRAWDPGKRKCLFKNRQQKNHFKSLMKQLWKK